jgi:hypothetical protein
MLYTLLSSGAGETGTSEALVPRNSVSPTSYNLTIIEVSSDRYYFCPDPEEIPQGIKYT